MDNGRNGKEHRTTGKELIYTLLEAALYAALEAAVWTATSPYDVARSRTISPMSCVGVIFRLKTTLH
ncbi:hypothetical protein [Leadbettera azotonutricia]|uniref:hypothetical protein n=1 Tax=Leadbettera azotonutricia TaxID=150829 RepID=UPI0011D19B1B|nr:hypothetical protein [Leadbettera azotonutricia]